MKVVKDAMVLIHQAKISILERACDYFKEVIIAKEVFEETVVAGKKKGMTDAVIIEQLIQKNKINVKEIKAKNSVSAVEAFNVYGGEAASVALYRQEDAELLITDDDNVRKKKDILEIKVIGSLGVLLKLRKENCIDQNKFYSALSQFRKIGWFSSSVLDKVELEGEKYG